MPVRIKYRCACMVAEAEFDVRERREDEDQGDWMDACILPAMIAAHGLQSPLCREDKVEYVKIPVPENAPFLGAAPKLDS